MQPVERYRAWALRGPFVLLHDGPPVTVPWPPVDALLGHDEHAPLRVRLHYLAGDAADQLTAVVGDDAADVLELIVRDLAEHFGCTRARHLMALLDRYGDAVAADLDEAYDIEVLDLMTGRYVPDQLMGRIDGLPRHSRLAEALAEDDELARQAAADKNGDDSDDEAASTAQQVRFTEWTPEVDRLTTIADTLGAILQALAAIAGSRINIPPEPRPAGATSRLRKVIEDEHYQDVLNDVAAAQQRWTQEHPEEG